MRSGLVDSAPLLPFIRRAIAERTDAVRWDGPGHGLRRLADDVAARFGTTWQAEHRALCRMLYEGRPIRVVSADRWAIALGLHPLLVWGDEAIAPRPAERAR